MNLYIIVEGEETELQLYPKWLAHLLPELTRINTFHTVKENNYYLFSGQGIPSIYRHTAIKDVNAIEKYDYLIVILDAEELSIDERKQELLNHIKQENIQLLPSCQLEIIIQNKCIETWFLGNKRMYKRNPQGKEFLAYSRHYNVSIDDPELMVKLPQFSRTAHFHEAYLRAMLKEYNIRYRKSRPKEVTKRYYLEELIKRVEETPTHLQSFSKLLTLLKQIKIQSSN